MLILRVNCLRAGKATQRGQSLAENPPRGGRRQGSPVANAWPCGAFRDQPELHRGPGVQTRTRLPRPQRQQSRSADSSRPHRSRRLPGEAASMQGVSS